MVVDTDNDLFVDLIQELGECIDGPHSTYF
jgi:hypothetical protein